MAIRKSITERFFDRVERIPEAGCWIWTGALHEFGYGMFHFHPGERERAYQNGTAHRLSWELHFGPIPEGLFVLHRCDVPACVNPAHLFLGTQKDNLHDMIRKGRRGYNGCQGTINGKAVLNDKSVIEIRKRIAQGASNKELAQEYNVNGGTIWFIRKGLTWKHVKNQ